MADRSNADLKEYYEDLPSFQGKKDETGTIIGMLDWKGLRVLEIGCGEGQLAQDMAYHGSKAVCGIDYSERAIKKAKQNCLRRDLVFYCCDYNDFINFQGVFDVVVMQGVLEHFDNPFNELQNIIDKFLFNGGIVITSSPNFINPRGYVWQTIEMLFDIKMSMADLHSLNPWDFELFCDGKYSLEWKSCDHDWAGGERTIHDFLQRFKSKEFKTKYITATRQVLTDERIGNFLTWLQKAVRRQCTDSDVSGANIVYKIRKEKGMDYSKIVNMDMCHD